MASPPGKVGLSARLLTFLDLVFTRVVNDCLTVRGTVRQARNPARTAGLSPMSRLGLTLNVEHESTRVRKITPVQYLTAIRGNLPRGIACWNQGLLTMRCLCSESVCPKALSWAPAAVRRP